MDIRYNTWNVRSLYWARSLITVAEKKNFKLDLMGEKDVRWGRVGTERAGEYTFFFFRKGNENYDSGIGFFVHKGIISANTRVEFATDTT
jgi:hypothetical protein